jgi:DNA-binding transcriptional ArsR family regulator
MVMVGTLGWYRMSGEQRIELFETAAADGLSFDEAVSLSGAPTTGAAVWALRSAGLSSVRHWFAERSPKPPTWQSMSREQRVELFQSAARDGLSFDEAVSLSGAPTARAAVSALTRAGITSIRHWFAERSTGPLTWQWMSAEQRVELFETAAADGLSFDEAVRLSGAPSASAAIRSLERAGVIRLRAEFEKRSPKQLAWYRMSAEQRVELFQTAATDGLSFDEAVELSGAPSVVSALGALKRAGVVRARDWFPKSEHRYTKYCDLDAETVARIRAWRKLSYPERVSLFESAASKGFSFAEAVKMSGAPTEGAVRASLSAAGITKPLRWYNGLASGTAGHSPKKGSES